VNIEALVKKLRRCNDPVTFTRSGGQSVRRARKSEFASAVAGQRTEGGTST
jgi:hypothetical protein